MCGVTYVLLFLVVLSYRCLLSIHFCLFSCDISINILVLVFLSVFFGSVGFVYCLGCAMVWLLAERTCVYCLMSTLLYVTVI
jgi:hypothetical protein